MDTPESKPWDWRSDWNVKTYMSEHLWLAELLAKVDQHGREEGKKEMLSKAIEKLEADRKDRYTFSAIPGKVCIDASKKREWEAIGYSIEALKSLKPTNDEE